MTIEELASEISCSIDSGYSEVLNMLKALDAASKYIVCLRQMVYSSESSVRVDAHKNEDRFGSEWTEYLMRHEKRKRSVDTSGETR